MAIAGQLLDAAYNRPGFDLFDFDMYVMAGKKGVSAEAASSSGHLKALELLLDLQQPHHDRREHS
jgi:transketolase